MMKSKKILTAVKCGVIVIGVIVIPMLYSFFYLDAFWDPYNSLDTLPVAIVNEDKGAVINSDSRNLGSEMVGEMKDDGTLKWIETTAADADNGVESGKYYARIIIPADFSKNVASAQTTQKVTAKLDYKVNQKRSYVAAQILGKAIQMVEMKTDAKIDQSITRELTAKLNETPGKLQELSDGLGKIYGGAGDLKSGADQVYSGAKNLKSGASSLYKGAGSLKAGITSLDAGIASLKTGADGLAANLSSLDSGIGDALDGAKKLNAGAAAIPQLNDGITKLNGGAAALNAQMSGSKTGTATFYDNVNALNTGTSAYVSSVNATILALRQDTAISESVFTTLSQKLVYVMTHTPADTATIQSLYTTRALFTNLSDTAETSQLTADDIAKTTAIQQQFEGSGSQLADGTAALLAQFGTGTADSPTLKDAVSQIAQGTSVLAANENNLTAMQQGILSLTTGLGQIKNGSAQLAAGANTLRTGVGTAKSGSAALVSGANALNSGAAQLSGGTSQLSDGARQVSSGTGDLQSGVATAKDKVNGSISDAKSQLKATQGLDSYANKPVNVSETDVYPVPNYGTSFAPYFLSLSLYVGALIMFFGIYLDPLQRMRMLSRDSGHKLLRIGVFALIGVGQALLLGTVLIYALHLKPKDPGGFFLSAILVSIVFISIVEFLLVNLGDLGKFLAIAFLVLQLTSCAGVFPMETVPTFFNKLYPYMPMTYSVRLFKDVISGYTKTTLYNDVYVLLGVFAFFTALTMLLSLTKRAKVRIQAKLEARANA